MAYMQVAPVSVDIRVNRISAISGHMHRLEGRRMRRLRHARVRLPSKRCICPEMAPNPTDSYLSTVTG